jgi:hypothetical protein
MPDPICEPCIAGKQHRHVAKEATYHASGLLDLIHTDLHGPLPVATPEGYKYWVTFTDDKSRHWATLLLKQKSEAFPAFKRYKAWIENKTGLKIKVVRDDKGGEWVSLVQRAYFEEHGIEFQHTVRAEPHQNGVAERANRTMAEHVTAILTEAHLPASFWGYAVQAYTYVRNRSPTSAVAHDVPVTVMFGIKPDISNLRVFGCTAYVHVKKDQRRGLESHTQKCVFIGYPAEYKAWIFYNPTTRKHIISKDAEFDERYFPGLSRTPLAPSQPSPPVVTPPSVFVDADDVDAPEQVGAVPNQVNVQLLPQPQPPMPQPAAQVPVAELPAPQPPVQPPTL